MMLEFCDKPLPNFYYARIMRALTGCYLFLAATQTLKFAVAG